MAYTKPSQWQVRLLPQINSFHCWPVGHATGDTFVKPAHSQKLFEATGTEKPDKTLELFPGDHNSGRSRDFYTKASTQALAANSASDVGFGSVRLQAASDMQAKHIAGQVNKVHVYCSALVPSLESRTCYDKAGPWVHTGACLIIAGP